MATYVPPKKNTAFIMYCGLPSASTSSAFQSNPTLAAGDAKVSIDGGALSNLATLPAVTPASSKMVKISLSTSEMNGDNITLVLSDQTSPPEWADVIINIQTSARQVDDLAFPNTSGRGMDVDASGGVEVGSFQANAITAAAINADAFTAAKFAADVTTEFQSGLATAANLATVAGYLDTEIAAILADTNELQTDWANGGRLDLILDARASQASVDDLPTNAELATALGTADDAVLAQIALVKAKTDNLPSDPADASDIASAFGTVNSTLSTIAGYIDTEVAAIKAKTDNLPSDPADASVVAGLIAAVEAKVDTIDNNVDAILLDTAEIGAAGAGLTAVPWNAAWDAEVQSEVADALAAYDPPTNAEMEARTLAAASYATATALQTVDDLADAIKAKTDNLGFTVTGQVDANIQFVNDVEVTGNGEAGTEWGPA